MIADETSMNVTLRIAARIATTIAAAVKPNLRTRARVLFAKSLPLQPSMAHFSKSFIAKPIW